MQQLNCNNAVAFEVLHKVEEANAVEQLCAALSWGAAGPSVGKHMSTDFLFQFDSTDFSNSSLGLSGPCASSQSTLLIPEKRL